MKRKRVTAARQPFALPPRGSDRDALTCRWPSEHPSALSRARAQYIILSSKCSPHTHQALHVISEVRTPPCGNIRRMNVEIPSLSVSDMRRLKATDCVGTYVDVFLFFFFSFSSKRK